MRLPVKTATTTWLLVTASLASAATITLNFENLTDGTVLTNQYSGLQFTNTAIWTAGLTLNEINFPPHSGTNVAADATGPITILFSTPVLNISAYFTYSSALTLNAFDALHQSVGTTTSAFTANFVSSGNPANELLQLAFAGGISSVTITGSARGSSFVLDDLTLTTPGTTGTITPEPSFVLLVPLMVLLLALTGRANRPPNQLLEHRE